MEPVSFINTFVKHKTFDKGLTNFTLYPFQEDLVNKLHNNKHNIFCSSRQSGKTSVPLFYLTHQALFNPNSNIFVFHNTHTIYTLLDVLICAYENTGNLELPNVTKRSKQTLEFDNGSKISVNPLKNGFVCGQSFTHVFLDEFAFVPYDEAQAFMESIFPVVSSTNAKLIIGSTKRKGSYFNELLMNAAQGSNDFVASVYDWYFVPGRDEKWKQETISMIGADAFFQEYQMTL